jgi:hypothetical protein
MSDFEGRSDAWGVGNEGHGRMTCGDAQCLKTSQAIRLSI